MGDNVIPGYNIDGTFVPTSNLNSILRNNDVINMRNVFPNLSNSQTTGLNNMRRLNNIPDATIHNVQIRKENVKRTHPDLSVRDREGVERALARNPRLTEHLKDLGYITLTGVGVYLIINVADLVGSVMDALNRTGGSWYYRGRNAADAVEDIDGCVLRYRSCGVRFADIQNSVCILDPLDSTNVDPLLGFQDARSLCNGYNYEVERSVCRGSDTNADPNSPQYLDISTLPTNHTIQCLEPYDLGDLVADLGLDWLLGDEGVFTASSNSFRSVSDNFLIILVVIGGVVLLVFIGFVVLRNTAK